ncbi:DUF4280 domain-containing protein [Flavobacterium sp.]|uniref:DUF4280 domain-containing protein n=1 Tax=Flavobacterium sp. TaxID=239 RepID=UPI00286E2A23|nr:DUF4280 domain-containing protein [Flavobacterium sp.]
MSEKHVVVQGATCKCKHSVAPQTDKLKVLSQTKAFANDKDGSKKLIATTMEIGQTLEKNTFGNCKMQPNGTSYNPCMATITKWSGAYEEVTYEENKGNPLLEDSKATCPIGGPDCIEIAKHGQKAEPNQQNAKNADKDVQSQLNPMTNLDEMEEEAKNEGLQAVAE